MTSYRNRVAKALIRVEGIGIPALLFSAKNAKGTSKHRKLELLGGGIDEDNPLVGLARELEEEEKLGVLARELLARCPEPRKVVAGGTEHYIFELSIRLEDYLDLRPDHKESLGFKLVPEAVLGDPHFQARLTPKTKEILSQLRMI